MHYPVTIPGLAALLFVGVLAYASHL